MHGGVGGELGVERRAVHVALSDEDRIISLAGEHFDAGTDTRNLRRPDEDCLERVAARGPRSVDERIELAAVGVSHDVDVEQAQRRLGRILDARGEEDQTGACGENRLSGAGEIGERVAPTRLALEEFEIRGRLAPGKNEAGNRSEILRTPDLAALDPGPRERVRVPGEVSLDGQDADGRLFRQARTIHRRAFARYRKRRRLIHRSIP